MESGPLSTPEFKEFAKDVVLFAHVTSRIPGEKHGNLLQEKGGRGFPYLVFMDAKGEVVAEPPGRSVEVFQKTAKKVQRYLDLKKIEDPTDAQKVELLLAEVEMGQVELEELEKRRAELKGLTPEQQAQLEQATVDLQIMDVVEKANPRNAEEAAAVGEKLLVLYREGKRPQGDQPTQAFYVLIMEHAFQAGLPDVFADALEAVRARFGATPGSEGFFSAQEQRLEQLKAKSKPAGE